MFYCAIVHLYGERDCEAEASRLLNQLWQGMAIHGQGNVFYRSEVPLKSENFDEFVAKAVQKTNDSIK